VGLDVPIAFIGNCFAGPMATSHAFFTLSVSVSSTVGGLRAGVLSFEGPDFYCALASLYLCVLLCHLEEGDGGSP
jgi:hypothetical protein